MNGTTPFSPGARITFDCWTGKRAAGTIAEAHGYTTEGYPVLDRPELLDHYRYIVRRDEHFGYELVLPSSQPRLLDEPKTT